MSRQSWAHSLRHDSSALLSPPSSLTSSQCNFFDIGSGDAALPEGLGWFILIGLGGVFSLFTSVAVGTPSDVMPSGAALRGFTLRNLRACTPHLLRAVIQ